ncbi:methionyl-tRNA formyltransferase [Salipaludibacillus keqinensis]|uniref:Methionyl-tRNA formyltransferase n=1 Tax=Salipaludibacillus keqinensis TaxID=2045207 RepID=A0A323TF33_9BACI|nr:methionyl-tRNA formyltransferase [Salipaludibacillus keqinensis]PYZ93200.1 methionyl-tRNA formyltransferase [Salipaludibacillus keqinensis]
MKIVFMGTPDFAVPVLHKMVDRGYEIALVVTQPDRPKGRKQVLTPPPVKQAAENLNIPVFQPEKIKNDWTKVQEVNPDLIVTAAFGQILPKELLDIPNKGCINVHASLLPKYRGGAPIHQSVIDGEKETGITIMYMVEKLDAGDIIAQRSIPILAEDTTGTMHDKLSELGADLLLETLPLIESGRASSVPQVEEKVTFSPNIKKDQEKIHWTKTATDIHNQIRGLNPWPVAFTEVQGKRFKIWESQILSEQTDQQPGTVIDLTNETIHVACGEGTVLSLLKVQPSGKKPMDVSTFLRGSGNTWISGMKLGEQTDE